MKLLLRTDATALLRPLIGAMRTLRRLGGGLADTEGLRPLIGAMRTRDENVHVFVEVELRPLIGAMRTST